MALSRKAFRIKPQALRFLKISISRTSAKPLADDMAFPVAQRCQFGRIIHSLQRHAASARPEHASKVAA